MTTHKNALANGTEIHQYQIESIIAHGGFGIVYKARHTHLDEAVVIKEYLPSEIATREGTTVHPYSSSEQDDYQDGLKRFLDEAKQLVQFKKHPNIVSCRDYFSENGTAYLVMDFEEGLSLSELLKVRKNEPLSEEHLVKMMLSILDGLKLVHEKGVLHRDIKPGNIFIRREDEEPLLIDFGAAKQNFSKHSKSMAPYTIGYAPMEQVSEDGDLGPWTDIYAIGAVMWRIISGQNPVDVNKRLTAAIKRKADPFISASEVGGAKYSLNLLNIIDKCVQLNETDRYQSVEELITAIKGSQNIKVSPIEDSTSTEQLQSHKTNNPDQDENNVSISENKSQSLSNPVIPMKTIGLVAGLVLLIGGGIAANNHFVEQAVLAEAARIKSEQIAKVEAEEKAKRDAAAKEKREAAARAKAKREASARAKAKREAAARAKAKREAAARAKAKREEIARTKVRAEKKEKILAEDKRNSGALFDRGMKKLNNKKYSEAYKLFMRAAIVGNAMAQERIGHMYYKGYSVAQDYCKSAKWYKKSVAKNDPYAQHDLGHQYEYGKCLKVNKQKAFSLYLKAAKQGVKETQYIVGKAYWKGELVAMNKTVAVKWLKKSARQGYNSAKKMLKRIGK